MPAATEAPVEGKPQGTVIHPNSSVTWEQIWAEEDVEKARKMWMNEIVGMGGENAKVPMRFFSDFNGKFAREWTAQHMKQSADGLGEEGLEAFKPFLVAAGLGGAAITAEVVLTFTELMSHNEVKYDVEVSTDSMINRIRHLLGDKAFDVDERRGKGSSDRVIEVSPKKPESSRYEQDDQQPIIQVLVGYADVEETVIDLEKNYDPRKGKKDKPMRRVTNVSISKLQGDSLLNEGKDVAAVVVEALSSEGGLASLFESAVDLYEEGKDVFDLVILKKTVSAAIIAVANEADDVRQTMIRTIEKQNTTYTDALRAACKCGSCLGDRKGIAKGPCPHCNDTLEETGYTNIADLDSRIRQAGLVL